MTYLGFSADQCIDAEPLEALEAEELIAVDDLPNFRLGSGRRVHACRWWAKRRRRHRCRPATER